MNLLKFLPIHKELAVKITLKEIDVDNVAHSTYNRGFAPLILSDYGQSKEGNKKELVKMR